VRHVARGWQECAATPALKMPARRDGVARRQRRHARPRLCEDSMHEALPSLFFRRRDGAARLVYRCAGAPAPLAFYCFATSVASCAGY